MSIALYSPVKDTSSFTEMGFYVEDLKALRQINGRTRATNSIKDLIKANPKQLLAYIYGQSLIAAILIKLRGGSVIFTGGTDQISSEVYSGTALMRNRTFAIGCALVARYILVPSSADKMELHNILPRWQRLQRKIIVQPHSVNVPSDRVSNRVFDKNRISAISICWLGNEANPKRKGLDRAIKLISVLNENGIPASLTVVGGGEAGRAYLAELALSLHVSEHIHFTGLVSEERKFEYLKTHDYYLQLSRYEGFGVAAAEALFAGLVVVHSNNGGLSDSIGESGVVIDCSELDEDPMGNGFLFEFMKRLESSERNELQILDRERKFSRSERIRAFRDCGFH